MRTPTPVLLVGLLAASCASPPGPPHETATTILEAVDANKAEQAATLFGRVSGSPNYRERIYPVLYEAAARRYHEGNTSGAAPVLRFLVRHYPESVAAREALLYALFIESGDQQTTNAELTEEIDTNLEELAARRQGTSMWTELVHTQRAIDRSKLEEARQAFSKFRSEWDGQPQSLAIYVDDLERYLTNNRGGSR